MSDDPGTVLASIRKALAEGGSTRSPLFQYLYRNHDRLAELFEESRPRWQAITDALTEQGFTGGDSKPLQPQSVRQLWYRVRKRHEANQAKKKPRPSPAMHAEPPPVTVHAVAAPEEGLSPQEALEKVKAEMAARSGRKV